MRTIAAADAALPPRGGVTPMDVREPDEHARERIHGARDLPSRRPAEGEPAVQEGRPVLFPGRSVARTAGHALRPAAKVGPAEACILEGGLDASKRAGQPAAKDRRQPLEPMGQARIAAGSPVPLGVPSGALLVAPPLHGLWAFAGAGPVFAGATGTCGLARLPQRPVPRNRPAAATPVTTAAA